MNFGAKGFEVHPTKVDTPGGSELAFVGGLSGNAEAPVRQLTGEAGALVFAKLTLLLVP